jgi:hypothetical protein
MTGGELRLRDPGRRLLPDRDARGQPPDPRGQLHAERGGRTGEHGWPAPAGCGRRPVFIPPDAKGPVGLAEDGTLSAGGVPIAQIGLWQPTDPLALKHQSGTLFDGGEVEPVEGSRILQGFLEDSNVNPVSEIARMIEVQRAYELGQKFLDAEDGRSAA